MNMNMNMRPLPRRSNEPYERLPGDEAGESTLDLNLILNPNNSNESTGSHSQSATTSPTAAASPNATTATASTSYSIVRGTNTSSTAATNLSRTASTEITQPTIDMNMDISVQQPTDSQPGGENTDVESQSDPDPNIDIDSADEEQQSMMPPAHANAILHSTLTQLLVEREYHRRGSSACSIILSLVLFRLGAEAIFMGDFTLLVITFFMTGYLVAWRRKRAAIENHLTRQIEEARHAQEDGNSNNIGIDGGDGADGADGGDLEMSRSRRRRARRDFMRGMNVNVNGDDAFDFMTLRNNDHTDIGMLGFQAQLALAIMESQRHIIETGGYGRPDGDGNGENQTNGVSDGTKTSWKQFKYDVNDSKLRELPDLKSSHKNEDPSCCICLGEYEQGEDLCQLRCGHLYHKECIDSWCENHIRCPLCNLNLEEEEETSCDSIV